MDNEVPLPLPLGAEAEAEAGLDDPLVAPTGGLTGHAVRGSKRRSGCGLCRSCLFALGTCIATKRASAVATNELRRREASRLRRAAVQKLAERAEVRAPLLLGPLCSMCGCAGHRASSCPVRQQLCSETAECAKEQAGAATAVLLAVQQLASAMLASRPMKGQLVRHYSSIPPAELVRLHDDLRTLLGV